MPRCVVDQKHAKRSLKAQALAAMQPEARYCPAPGCGRLITGTKFYHKACSHTCLENMKARGKVLPTLLKNPNAG